MSFCAGTWSRRCRVLAAVVALGVGGCEREQPVRDDTWITEPEFRIGDALEGDALFSWIPYLRVTDDGRVFVLEPNSAAVSVWSREGDPLFSIGRPGQGPGDFVFPDRIHVGTNGFFVREGSRFTYYNGDGTLLRTAPGIPTAASFQGWRIRTFGILGDGSFLGFPTLGAAVRLGWLGDEPVSGLPLLSVAKLEGSWVMDTVYVLDTRNESFGVRDPRSGSPHQGMFGSQRFGDNDLFEFDPGSATVLILRRNTGPGRIELLEVDAVGDTVWNRALAFAPLELDEARVGRWVNEVAEVFSQGPHRVPGPEARGLVRESLYVPEYLPVAAAFTVASSGQIWLKGWEQGDSLRVWYSIDRGDMVSPPRKVLAPEWFWVLDATATHVWGVWTDSLGVPYVVGRRLVRAKSG